MKNQHSKSTSARKQPTFAVTVSLFNGVRPEVEGTAPHAWSSFVGDVLPAMLAEQRRDKKRLPGFVLAHVEGERNNENVGAHTALAIDVDALPDNDLGALQKRARKYTCAVYETPSSTDAAPRVRVIAALGEPLAPDLVPAARRAFAEALGLDPDACGTSGALPASQVMFCGRVKGTRERGIWPYEGELWQPPADLAASPVRSRVRDDAGAIQPYSVPEGEWGSEVPDLSAIVKACPPAGHDADRHSLVRGLGGWLGRRGFGDAQIEEAIRTIPADDPAERAAQAVDAARRVRAGLEAPGWEAMQRWASVYGRKSTLKRLEETCRDPVEPEGFGEPWSAAWARSWPRDVEYWRKRNARVSNDTAPGAVHPAQDGTGLHLHQATGWPLILQRGATYWMHSLSEPRYGRQFPRAELETRVARDMAGYIDEDDRKPATLHAEWTSTIERVVFSYTALQTTYEPDSQTLHVAALDRMPAERAKFHEAIDRWLRALFGADYERGAQWLASCASLDRPAPCLYLIGRPEVGKSLLFDGVARLWGLSSPVHMGEVISAFNEKQCECPLVYSDEGLPAGLDLNRFRQMVTEHDRRVNRKQISKVDVLGCNRVAIGANNSSVLRWARTGELSPDDQAAIAARLLVIRCGEGAKEAVEALDTEAAASREIAEHALWLASGTPLEAGGRMCVAPHGGEALIRDVVNDRYAPIARAIVEALVGGEMARKAAHVWRSKLDDRVVFVHAEQLHGWLRESERQLRVGDVKDACRALARPGGDTTRPQRLPHSELRPRVYALDATRIGEAAGVSIP